MTGYCPVLIGIAGTRLLQHELALLQHPLCAGVVLFGRNYLDPEQLAELCTAIKAINSRLLIAVDQEGGRVQRFQQGFTALPPLAVYGELYIDSADQALDYAYRHGRVMAAELRARGVDLSFAPVLDVCSASNIIGDRAFSQSPAVIAQLGRAMIAGMHDAGMAAVGKHFPGHGTVLADTHTEVVDDHRPLVQIRDHDLQPFQVLAGDLDAMMLAHVCYPRVDAQPAGYSRIWIQDILRQQLGYTGLVISDDLDMHAGAVAGAMASRLAACSNAGCDLALICKAESAAAFLSQHINVSASANRVAELLPKHPAMSMTEMLSVGEFRHWQQTLQHLSATV
ncbi:MAG: beta-N-acetylhexosaminidase [Gammaproteobacteria bacterium]|nr:beta-N-acetylhexosaminidase [Gammaproteobacteria bacterium]